jgi:hypothetical protein
MTPSTDCGNRTQIRGDGCPLILEEWHLRKEWNRSILNVDYLVKQLPDQGRSCLPSSDIEPTVDLDVVSVELPTRNVYNRSDKTTTLKEYIDYARALPQFAPKGTVSLTSSSSQD